MDLSTLTQYLSIAVVGICLCVGYILKHAVPGDKINRFIPLIMGALGLGIQLWISRFSVTPDTVLGGLFSGLASTGLYEAFTQLINTEEVQ